MTRRYVRVAVEPFQRVDVPLLDFPSGEGPPLYVSTASGPWTRLGLGQGAIVSFAERVGGAFAWGMTATRVVVVIRRGAPGDAGQAYCHHAGPGPLDPLAFTRALAELECDPSDVGELYVVIASPGEVAPADEAFFRSVGVRPDRTFTYSNCFLTQFGVSASGCVGEAL